MLSPSQPHFKNYLASVVGFLAAGVIIVVTSVIVVDPYGLYGVINSSFNVIKPGLNRYQSEIKLQRAIHSNPEFVILGNSRAEIGFDPDSPAFGRLAGRGFNLSVPGTGINTAIEQLDNLATAGIKPSIIIIGVEFIDFLTVSTALGNTKSTSSASKEPSRSVIWWQFDALFSMETLKDVVRTLRLQRSEETASLSSKGFNPLNEYKAYVRDDGYHKIFEQRSLENAAIFRHKSQLALSKSDLESLHTLLLAATKNGAEVKMLIYPYHAQIMAMFEDAGLWSLFELWKLQLVEEVAILKQEAPERKLALFDFSGFGTMNCEHIPLKSEKGSVETKWYWEAGHFKKTLGDLIVRRIMQQSDASSNPDFGVALERSTQLSNKLRIERERSVCSLAQPRLFEYSRRLFR
ncbi:hypothetical protein [Massilia sp. PWRC2]|uniref:hypothetical protein n=1 Tax=Massilia sp. PWRC2 TaxID=2804626 RepID=UPI003CF77A9B